jgi:hypothetical protein
MTAENALRLKHCMSQGVVITSTSSMSSPWPLNAAVSERKGNRIVCFSRLNRSSSRTNVGTPSLSNSSPESWVLVTIPSTRKTITPTSRLLYRRHDLPRRNGYAIRRSAFSGRFIIKRSGKSAKVVQPMNQNRSLKAIICA